MGSIFDGVLADFCTAYERLFVELTGRNTFDPWMLKEGPVTWNWPLEFGYTKAETTEVWNRIKASSGFWHSLDPLYPSIDVLSSYYPRLRQAGHEIIFVTSRPGTLAKFQTERWLQTWFSCPTVVIAKTGHKGLIARGLELDAIIDDNADNCFDVLKESPTTRMFIVPRRYNAYAHSELQSLGCGCARTLASFFEQIGADALIENS